MQFGKVFASLWQGSMWGKSSAQLVFVYMLANCDAHGVIDVTPEAIAGPTGLPLDSVLDAISVLESPDPRSRSRAEDGRRILRLDAERDWGWSIVNHALYRRLRDDEMRRSENTERMRAQRHTAAHNVAHGEGVRHGAPPCAQAEAEGRSNKAPSVPSGTEETPGGKLPDVFLIFPTAGGGTTQWILTNAQRARFAELFPGASVDTELRKALAWCEANRANRKTPRGMLAFLTRWLSKAQDSGSLPRNGAQRKTADAGYSQQVRVIGGGGE